MNPNSNPIPDALLDDLKAYLDGELPLWRRGRVRWQLARRADLRREKQIMERISSEIKDINAGSEGALKPDLRARILAAVPSGKPQPDPNAEGETFRPRPRFRKPVMAWGVVATGTIGWFLLGPLRTQLTQSSPSQAAREAVAGSSRELGMANQAYTQDYEERYAGANGGGESVPAEAGAMAAAAPPAPKPLSRQVFAPTNTPSPAPRIETRAGRRDTLAKAPTTDAFKVNWKAEHKRAYTIGGFGAAGKDVLKSYEADGDVERIVHREADITIEVVQVETVSETVENLAKTSGGYVASNQMTTGDDGLKTATLLLKIPVDKFETALSQASRLGELKGKNLSGEDLTDKVSDQQQAENTLKSDIAVTAGKLHQKRSGREQAENRAELRELKIRAAQTAARLKNLHRLGALSTLTVNVNEKPKPAPPTQSGFLSDLNGTMSEAGHSLVLAAKLPVTTVIWLLAYAPVWIALLLGYRWAIRR